LSAGDKHSRTEKATPKRRGEARKKGQIARSPELNSTVGLLAGFAALVIGGPHMLGQLEGVVSRGLSQAGDPNLATAEGLGSLVSWGIGAFAAAVAPVVVAAGIAGLIANVAQVRLNITLSVFKPQFSKMNPGAGLRRLVGPSGLVEAGKAIVKLGFVGGLAFLSVWPKLPRMGALVGIPPADVLSEVGGQVVSIVVRVGAVLLVLAFADLFWQRHRIDKTLRMTKEEVKQEARQTDVAPEVRSAMRRKQFQLARRRMLADVPTADVVVVNPTHYAAALRYDGSKPAPELVAKGVDHVAAAIRAAAEEHGVPIVSNPPLARTLYRQVELGAQIPAELYAGVAEVLAYVYRVAGRRRHAARRRRALASA
jgi:flagellar biosynthesis protein FlhB